MATGTEFAGVMAARSEILWTLHLHRLGGKVQGVGQAVLGVPVAISFFIVRKNNRLKPFFSYLGRGGTDWKEAIPFGVL